MQPDSFMKKYYAPSSEWDIFECFAETMQNRLNQLNVLIEKEHNLQRQIMLPYDNGIHE